MESCTIDALYLFILMLNLSVYAVGRRQIAPIDSN